MSSWFVTHRIEWIVETLRIFGFINRDHIMRKFGVSVPQASADLQATIAAHPDLMRYNVSAKRYERIGGDEPMADDLGMKIMPVEPTDIMVEAGRKWLDDPDNWPLAGGDATGYYAAMLQAFTDSNIEKEVR